MAASISFWMDFASFVKSSLAVLSSRVATEGLFERIDCSPNQKRRIERLQIVLRVVSFKSPLGDIGNEKVIV